MKKLFRLFFVIFSIFVLVSCGGNEGDSSQENGSDSDGNGASVSLRMLRDSGDKCYPEMAFDCITPNLVAMSFLIKNSKGEIIFKKSVDRNGLSNLIKKGLTGIKKAENATLIVSVFLGNDTNTVEWQGKVTSLNFENGKTTKATVLLYPTAPKKDEIEMPEKLITARFGHSATVLPDGRILVAGGFPSCGSNGKCVATETVEIIDMESGKVEMLANMTGKRAMHKAVTLNDGSILFIGGVQGFTSVQQTGEEAFKNYPALPYSQLIPVTTIEKYMPSYPKYNMRENSGIMAENKTETVPVSGNIPFMAFQSIFVKQTLNNEGENTAPIEVFLVGGVDENNQPSNKTYKFTITDSTSENGTVSVSDVTEFAETSSPMLLPAVAYNNGSILAVGGRPAGPAAATRDPEDETTDEETTDDETGDETGDETTEVSGKTGVVASIISESESKDIKADMSNNIFFANSIAVNNALYTLGGMPNQSGTLINSDQNGVIRKWDLNDGSFQTPANGNLLSSNDKNVAFAETLYNADKNQIILIGGTDAENFYQVINPTDLEDYRNSPSHKMSDKRIMPKASIVPAGKIGDRQIFVITGGTSALDSSGSAVNTIKINLL